MLARVQLFATPWTAARQAPLSMEFSRQEYRSGLPFPFPGDLPNPGIEPGSLALRADSLLSEPAAPAVVGAAILKCLTKSETALSLMLSIQSAFCINHCVQCL